MSVLAELLAIKALREYLLRALPAKVTAVNATRAAVMTAPYAGPYTVTGNLRLATQRGDLSNWLVLPGNSGDYISTPDSAAISLAGNLDIRVKAMMPDWSPASEMALIGKQSYVLSRNATTFVLRVKNSSGATRTYTFDALAITDFTRKCVRATVTLNAGAFSVATLYTSADEGVTWDQQGAAKTSGTIDSVQDTAAALQIGADGTDAMPMTGYVFWAEVRDGIDGTVAARFDAEDVDAGAVPFTGSYESSTTGETWTINGAASITETIPQLTTGSRTATEIAAEFGSLIPGINASADAQNRLVFTATGAPTAGTPSVISLAPELVTGANTVFGWSAGGEFVVRSALVAPGSSGIMDGEPEVVEMESGFGIVIGARQTAPRSDNTRDDCHITTADLEIMVAEPNMVASSAHELIASAARCVREVLLEDRTLDGAVHLTRIPRIQYQARTWRFASGGAGSPLMSSAPTQIAITVFERN